VGTFWRISGSAIEITRKPLSGTSLPIAELKRASIVSNAPFSSRSAK
jgi:hypothetical protein